MKKITSLILFFIISTTLCSCANEDALLSNESNDSFQSETELNNSGTVDDQFISMANHDNYIIGTIIDSCRTEDYSKSYIIIESNGTEYRIEGLCWDKDYTQCPFSVATSMNLGDTYIENSGVIVFYDEGNINNNVIYPKDIYISSQNEDLYIRAEAIKKISERLVDNYSAIEEHKLLTPDDAMLALIKNKGMKNPVEDVDKYGAKCYTCDGYRIYYSGIWFSECFGMTDEEFIKYYEDTHFDYPYFLESLNFDYELRKEPYIMYRVAIEKYDSEYIGPENYFYYVSITGHIE